MSVRSPWAAQAREGRAFNAFPATVTIDGSPLRGSAGKGRESGVCQLAARRGTSREPGRWLQLRWLRIGAGMALDWRVCLGNAPVSWALLLLVVPSERGEQGGGQRQCLQDSVVLAGGNGDVSQETRLVPRRSAVLLRRKSSQDVQTVGEGAPSPPRTLDRRPVEQHLCQPALCWLGSPLPWEEHDSSLSLSVSQKLPESAPLLGQ